ncbi:MAG: metal-dependent transcriptional regulator [Planctomycetaceae bacterium]|nr:metal-dependent transcriptional regulator [Planctomycetaceae bacterium]
MTRKRDLSSNRLETPEAGCGNQMTQESCARPKKAVAPAGCGISEAMGDYLEAIYHISREQGGGVRPGLISARLGVHKSTVTIALRHLDALKLIRYSPYQEVHLTENGFQHAESVIRRHRIFYRFLRNVLDIENDLAEKTACRLEHAIPPEIVDRFADFVAEQIASRKNTVKQHTPS